jgi:hypothetical protein
LKKEIKQIFSTYRFLTFFRLKAWDREFPIKTDNKQKLHELVVNAFFEYMNLNDVRIPMRITSDEGIPKSNIDVFQDTLERIFKIWDEVPNLTKGTEKYLDIFDRFYQQLEAQAPQDLHDVTSVKIEFGSSKLSRSSIAVIDTPTIKLIKNHTSRDSRVVPSFTSLNLASIG